MFGIILNGNYFENQWKMWSERLNDYKPPPSSSSSSPIIPSSYHSALPSNSCLCVCLLLVSLPLSRLLSILYAICGVAFCFNHTPMKMKTSFHHKTSYCKYIQFRLDFKIIWCIHWFTLESDISLIFTQITIQANSNVHIDIYKISVSNVYLLCNFLLACL